jgi:hypothetical protein
MVWPTWIKQESFTFNPEKWSCKTTYGTEKSICKSYYCINKTIHSCQARMKMELKVDENLAIYYVSGTHAPECLASCNSKSSIRPHIRKLYSRGIIKPREIYSALVSQQIEETGIQLSTIYATIKSLKARIYNTGSSINSDNIEEFCRKYSTCDSDEKCYVPRYSTSPLRILLTSKSLILKLAQAKNIHIDGTYKNIINGFPVVITGFSDLNGRFFLTAVAIVRTESAESYEWILKTLKDESAKHKVEFKPVS